MALLLGSSDNSLRAGALSVDVEPSSFRDYVSVNKQYNVCDYHVTLLLSFWSRAVNAHRHIRVIGCVQLHGDTTVITGSVGPKT